MTKEQIKSAQTALEAYWAGSATQSIINSYASGDYVTVKAG